MTDIVCALSLLSSRINKKQQLGFYDLGIIAEAEEEIKRLRKREAILEAELNKPSSNQQSNE